LEDSHCGRNGPRIAASLAARHGQDLFSSLKRNQGPFAAWHTAHAILGGKRVRASPYGPGSTRGASAAPGTPFRVSAHAGDDP
jgi:hypothetical protein